MSSAQAFPAAAATAKRSRTSTLLPRFAWAVLVYNVVVILWGAVVRATSSGAGCGDHWPLCNGVVLQSNPRLATLIELAHRVSSGLTLPLVLLLLLWTFRSTVSGHLARIASHCRGRIHLQRGVAGRAAGAVAAHGGQPFAGARGLSFSAPGQYSAATGRTHACGALPIAR